MEQFILYFHKAFFPLLLIRISASTEQRVDMELRFYEMQPDFLQIFQNMANFLDFQEKSEHIHYDLLVTNYDLITIFKANYFSISLWEYAAK